MRAQCDRILEGGKGEYRLFGKVVTNLFFSLPRTDRMAMLPLYGGQDITRYGPTILMYLRRLDSDGLIMLSEIWLTEYARKFDSVKSVLDLPPAWESPDKKPALGVIGIHGGGTYLSKTSVITRTPVAEFSDEEFFELPHLDGALTGWPESLLAAK